MLRSLAKAPFARLASRAALSLAAAALTGCEPPQFDDHAIGALATARDFFDRAPREGKRAVQKLVITGLSEPDRRAVRYYDSHFYELHDEWCWFQELNGHAVEGMPFGAVSGLRFSTVEEIYDWARPRGSLPLDLRWVDDGRLYSPIFYDLGVFRRPLEFGLATLMYLEATDARPERWVFYLEYVFVPTHDELVIFFEELLATLPAEIADRLEWAVRSPAQEALAQRMETEGLAYGDRTVRFKDLGGEGDVEVYNEGLTAGRLHKVPAGGDYGAADPSDVLLVEQVPDYLPPTAGLVSAEPQTPLAHVNLLAKNRRIPNAFRGGLFEDIGLDQLARARVPVAVLAEAPGTLTIRAITEGQYASWRQLFGVQPASVPQVEVAALPYTIDLATRALSEVEALRPAIGGKAAGFLALLAGAPGAVPDRPLAITIRGYAEHVAPLLPLIREVVGHPHFRASPRARFLALEGAALYPVRFPSVDDARYLLDFLAAHEGDALGRLARAGGLSGEIEARPIALGALGEILAALQAQFGGYDARQGLRFRSSSTAEDIEGFNGAGLYTSSTGFLDPSVQAKRSDRLRSVEAAVKATWASYWRSEAYEERALEGIDHFSGNMAMVVHARHDDDQELANGVFLFTALPPGGADAATLELNVQKGAESVTNPEPGSGVLPEVDRVVRARDGRLRVERVRPSTLVAEGEVVFSDEKLLALFADAEAVANAWLLQAGEDLPPALRARGVVLDFEVREVADDWPRGTGLPRRVVLRQVRSVEPGTRRVPEAVRLLPLPREVLGRARRVDRVTCEAAELKVAVVGALTDPLLPPDLRTSKVPFTGSVALTFKAAAPQLGRAAGESVELDHLAFESVQRGLPGAGLELSVALVPSTAATAGFSVVRLTAAGTAHVGDGATGLEVAGLSCRSELLYSTPQEYLRSLL